MDYGRIIVSPVVTTKQTFPQNVSGTAVGLSGVTAYSLDANKQNVAWITVETNDIRYRLDGLSPTTGVGHVLPKAGTPLQIFGKKKILDFRFIGSGGTSAVVTVTLDNTANAGGIV